MSIPTAKTPAQTSIRSFFQPSAPKYAPPPLQNPRPPPPPVSQPEPPIIQADPPPAPADPVDIAPLPSTLPRRANIRPVKKEDHLALQRINSLLLPVAYPDTFYAFASDAITGRHSRVITWTEKEGEPEKIIGGVVCRIEPATPSGPATLYIRSLCLLSPYRGLGLVNATLDNIIVTALESGVKTVTAHVWTENEDGLKWYDGRGFKKGVRPIDGYYLKLRPGSAWLVERNISNFELDTAPEGSKASTPPSRSEVSSPTAAVVNLPPFGGPSGPANGARPPPRVSTGQSYQNQRAETEWNDLPIDMAAGRLAPPKNGSEPGSGQSSRSSSAARKKRDRSYPAAAFGKTE